MRLIGSLTSPYVRKVRIVMAEKMLDYHLEIENVWSADTRIQAHNPLGKVPCLILQDGDALFDSRVIVDYLDRLSPEPRLIPAPDRQRATAQCWEATADGLLDACVLIFKENQRPPAQRSPEWIDRQYNKIHATLKTLEQRLGVNPYCLGSDYSLADIAVGCALGYLDLRFAELDWRSSHPALARLYSTLSQRPAFIDTVPNVH